MSDPVTFGPCTDHGCVFGHLGGMGTNGGCHCLERLRDVPITRMTINNLGRAIRKARERAALTPPPDPVAEAREDLLREWHARWDAYRMMHDTHGDGSPQSGRAWDQLSATANKTLKRMISERDGEGET